MKKLIFYSLFTFLLYTIGNGQIHRAEFSSAANYNEESFDMTCVPCQGNQILLSVVEGNSNSVFGNYLSLDLYANGALTNNAIFPIQAGIEEFRIFGDAQVKRILNTTTNNCDGFLVQFTAITNQNLLPGSSTFFETHLLRLDHNLNVVWHKIPFSNQGFSSFAIDFHIDNASNQAMLLLRKDSNKTLMAEVDLTTGIVTNSKEIAISNNGTLSSEPKRIIYTGNLAGVPKYAITGVSAGQVFLYFIQASITVERRKIYDIDSDGIADEQGLDIAIHGNNIYIAGSYTQATTPSIITKGYLLEVQGVGPPSSRGNIVNTTEYDLSSNSTYIYDLEAKADGSGLLMSGHSNYFDSSFLPNTQGTPFIMEVQGDGTVNWAKEYHKNTVDQGYFNSLKVDGSFVCACGTAWQDVNTIELELLSVKTDALGSVSQTCDEDLPFTTTTLTSVEVPTTVVLSTESPNNINFTYPLGNLTYIENQCTPNPATISGKKWIDTDCDGLINNGEIGGAGWTIELKDNTGAILQTTVTDSNGDYSFSLFNSGSYFISEVNQPGFNQETPASGSPYSVTTTPGQMLTGFDFGNCPCDDIIGIPAIQNWTDPNPTLGFYVRDVVEFDGYIIASSTDEIAVWDDVSNQWNIVYISPTSNNLTDIIVFNNKLFFGGTTPGYFDNSIYLSATPSPTFLTGLPLVVEDFEILNTELYAGGSNGTGSNIYKTAPVTPPNFTLTTFPNTADVYQLGAHNNAELVVIGPFGTTLSTPSNDIVIFNPATGVYTGMGQGLDGLSAPQFEYGHDIISLNNKIHVGGRFTGIIGSVTNDENSYAIFDTGSGSWESNTGCTGPSGVWDMDLFQGHIYIVGFFNTINNLAHPRGVVFDGTNYTPLNNSLRTNVLYATAVQPSGIDRLYCFSELQLEYAVCGGSNCAASIPDVTACPGESINFQPFISFPTGTYLWDFGNGATSTLRNPTYTYFQIGTYTVTLDYDDGFGCAGQTIAQVNIVNDPNCNFIPPPGEWKKLYGSTEEETVHKVKAFNDGVYVAGFKRDMGIEYATFTKFDITNGNLLWEKQLNLQSEFKDFDYNPTTNEFIVVGRTPIADITGTPLDNQFIIAKWDSNGGAFDIKMYDDIGRDGFEQQVIVHKNPLDSDAPIYVLTGKNASLPANSADLSVMYNFENNLNPKWIRDYPEISGVELEVQRGLEDLTDGNVILLGNGSIANEGVLLKVNGATGTLIADVYHPGNIDWYDAHELSNGNILLSGTDFGNGRALLMVVDPVNFNHINGITYTAVKSFEKLWYDDISNSIYTVAREKFGLKRNIVHKTDFNLTTNTFTSNWAKYLDNGETEFKDPHVYYSDQFNKLFYADARKGSPGGSGDFDLLIASMDKEMINCPCVQNFGTNNQSFTVNTSALTCNDPSKTELPFTQPDAFDQVRTCGTFCGPILTCDFTFTTDCFDLDLLGSASSGAAPYTFDWDIDGDIIYDLLNQNPTTHTYPSLPNTQTYNVTMRVTDAAGTTCTTTKSVTVQDITPPAIICPGDITLNTDPGQCYATHGAPPFTDDCDDMPTMTCTATGTSSGTNITQFDKGITTVTCVATDASGNSSSCTYDITVIDTELPTVSCPTNIVVTIPGCDGGTNVNFAAPIFADNCPMVSATSTHQSGDYFECGVTTVTYTAIDMSGNTNTCSFTINIVCQCAALQNASIACNPLDEQSQYFTLVVNSLTGLSNPGAHCTATVSPAQGGIILTNITTSWSGTQLTVTGTASASCMPPSLVIDVDLSCNCLQAPPINCTVTAVINTLCCSTIEIEDISICKNGPQVSIPILRCTDLCDPIQVRWYVQDAPCTGVPSGPTFMVTNGCQDLILDPQFHSGDICIYAEVDVSTSKTACQGLTLVTNVANITLCEPVTCGVSTGQTYCYDGTAITPALLTGTLAGEDADCPYTLQWYDDNGPIPGETGLTYQPPSLSIPSGSLDCSVSYTYTLKVNTVNCGTEECAATILLWNDNAPQGVLALDPSEQLPLCYGGDATLRYTPACAGEPEMWDWFVSTDNITWNPLTTQGTQNPIFNTNRLYQDTWYRVEKQNGTCPIDQVDFFIPVNVPLQITSFDAVHTPTCSPTSIKLFGDFMPVTVAPWSYTIEWYRNGQVINTTTALNGPISWTYVPSSLSMIPGNYYIKVIDNCCGTTVKSNIVAVETPYEVAVAGPCYRCNDDPITLDGLVINPQSGASCTYQWYNNGTALPGATGTQLQVLPYQTGTFTFEVTCVINGATCVKSDTYTLLQCGTSCPPIINLYGTVPDGIYHAAQTINLYGTIPVGANVVLKAGTAVIQHPGSNILLGANCTILNEACP